MANRELAMEDVKLIWKTLFKVKPRLKKSEKVENYFFEIKNGGTVVERIYETSSFEELHPDRKDDYECAEETLSRLDAEKIREILLKRMIYQRIFSPIKIERSASPLLINKDDLMSSGVELKRPSVTRSNVRFAVINVGDSLAESENFWNSAFTGTAIGQEKEIIRIADWLERSVSETDSMQSFILSWIGFNGLYNLFASLHNSSGKPDPYKFELIIEVLLKAIAEEIVENITNEIKMFKSWNIRSDRGNKNWSNDLCNEMQMGVKNNIQILKLVARCIYSVRKQVFHEAPKTEDILKRVNISKSALFPITTGCLKSFITH